MYRQTRGTFCSTSVTRVERAREHVLEVTSDVMYSTLREQRVPENARNVEQQYVQEHVELAHVNAIRS